MNKILQTFHRSIVLRSAVIVLLVSGMVGYGLLGLITKYAEPKIQQSLTNRLVELVKTVEKTAGIACYLSDTGLASEVAKGLLSNRDVERVLIINDQGTLADFDRATLLKQESLPPKTAGKKPAPPHFTPGKATTSKTIPQNAIIQPLASPFKAETNVGSIAVIRNEAEIQAQVDEATSFIRLLLILQTTVITLVVTAIAIGYIAHPIHQISKRLNALSAVDGEKIEIPRGHHKNEIGQLVDDVNFLIDKLVSGIMSERHLRMEREVEEKRFRAIFENAETGIFVIDRHGQLNSFNPSFRETMGIGEIDIQPGATISLLEILGDQASRAQLMIDSCLQENRTKTDEIMLHSSATSPRWVNMILNPVEDNLIQGVINDITEAKMREAYANKLALTDALTGLGNRLGFERQIEDLINERRLKPERSFTMMMIDLDRFKQVNDTHGHDVGDAILVHVARNIVHSIRKADYAARLGGDEFIVLLPFVTDENIVTKLAQTLIRNISQPIVTKRGIQTSVGASIGITLVRGPEMKREEIVKQADLALYEVKQAGRNDFRIYRSENPLAEI